MPDIELVAPPFPNQFAFFCRFFSDVSSFRDELGHPLHEVDFRGEQADSEYRRCPFPGSRRGYLMNQRALTEVLSVWDEIRASLTQLMDRCGMAQPSDDLGSLWRKSLIPMFLPLFMRMSRPDCEIKTHVSGLFKVMLDVPTTVDLMVISDQSGRPTTTSVAPQEVAAFAEDRGVLLNGAWACAGSSRMIREMIEILAGQASPREGNKLSKELVPLTDPEQEPAYEAMTIQYTLGVIYQLAMMHLMESGFSLCPPDQRGSPAREHSSPHALSAYERRRRIALSVVADLAGLQRCTSAFALCCNEASPRIDSVMTGILDEFISYLDGTSSRWPALATIEEVVGEGKELTDVWVDCLRRIQVCLVESTGAPKTWFKGSFGFLADQTLPLNLLSLRG